MMAGAEGNDIGERVELPPQNRRLLPPPGDVAVQDVEYQCSEDQAAGKVDVPDVAGLEVGHGGEQGPGAADGVGEGEPVRQLEFPDHREGLARPVCLHRMKVCITHHS